MRDRRTLTIYLAGPVSNCNEKQRTEWRKEIKTRLSKLGHKCFDPTDHTDWIPLKEMVEIDKSDVVIANLWRESIGTVVGIVQARRKGKPVILIDPNYLDSLVLKQMVGKEFVVRGIDEAVNVLPQVIDQLNKVVNVKKSNGDVEPFNLTKLHDSFIAVCAKTHIEDAVLPDLVVHTVHRSLNKTQTNGEVHAEQIKRMVFETLNDIAKDSLYEEDLKRCAVKLREGWEEYERVKKDQRWALQRIEEVEAELRDKAAKTDRLEQQNEALRLEADDLRRSLRRLERDDKLGGTAPLPSASAAEELRRNYANYFPTLTFTDAVLRWLISCDKSDRHAVEGKLRLINLGQADGKHEVPGTTPLIWQHDAGHGLRIYFRQDTDKRIAILRLGTKGSQEADYAKLKKRAAAHS